jgi:hypothetical protein
MLRMHYLSRIEVDAMDREPLESGLEDEPGALHDLLPFGRLESMIAEGEVVVDVWRNVPLSGFGEALATVSVFLSQIIDGFAVAEEVDERGNRLEVQCARYIARCGELVVVPVGHKVGYPSGEIEPAREDPAVLKKMWPQLPRWAQDGYRLSFPELRGI